MIEELKKLEFEQKFEQLWTQLKGKTRDEKLPYILEFAQELVEVAQNLEMDESDYLSLYLLKKVISDRHEQAKDRVISVVDPEARTG